MKLNFLPSAERDLDNLKNDRPKARILKDVVKALNLMEVSLRHPSLNIHEYQFLQVLMTKRFLGPMLNKILQELIGYFGIMDRRKI